MLLRGMCFTVSGMLLLCLPALGGNTGVMWRGACEEWVGRLDMIMEGGAVFVEPS